MKRTLLIISSVLSLTAFSAQAFVMGGTNYRILQDSINFGGTENATSASYRNRDTLGEVATGDSESASYKLKAGYRQLDEVYVSLSIPTANIIMPSLNMSVNTSATTGVWTVKTDSASGYIFYLETDRINSLDDSATGQAFTDYTATSGSPSAWSVSSGNYMYGFSAYGNDVPVKWGAGSSCLNPSGNSLNYAGFSGTSSISVAQAFSRTSSSGTITTMCLAAEQNGAYAPSGSYVSEITGTVIAQ